ncbi:11116_t:CDS:2 [Dentiscutata erythropus]|uniref:11116_t:CDS:1 n=1 Tax=Dentiscutata erythropus TaxID=1348616 RepID=A0A9N9ND38_9GLOM|nr:11116_t:CDS:2 [Dentiscutata erythropus]
MGENGTEIVTKTAKKKHETEDENDEATHLRKEPTKNLLKNPPQSMMNLLEASRKGHEEFKTIPLKTTNQKTANGLLKEPAKNGKLAKEPTEKRRAELTGRSTETRA